VVGGGKQYMELHDRHGVVLLYFEIPHGCDCHACSWRHMFLQMCVWDVVFD